jgi:hypothetical protein
VYSGFGPCTFACTHKRQTQGMRPTSAPPWLCHRDRSPSPRSCVAALFTFKLRLLSSKSVIGAFSSLSDGCLLCVQGYVTILCTCACLLCLHLFSPSLSQLSSLGDSATREVVRPLIAVVQKNHLPLPHQTPLFSPQFYTAAFHFRTFSCCILDAAARQEASETRLRVAAAVAATPQRRPDRQCNGGWFTVPASMFRHTNV